MRRFFQFLCKLPAVERVQQIDVARLPIEHGNRQLAVFRKHPRRNLIGIAPVFEQKFFHAERIKEKVRGSKEWEGCTTLFDTHSAVSARTKISTPLEDCRYSCKKMEFGIEEDSKRSGLQTATLIRFPFLSSAPSLLQAIQKSATLKVAPQRTWKTTLF